MKPITVSELLSKVGKVDLVITSASFEERSFAIVRNLQEIDNMWVCYNTNEEEFFHDNVIRLSVLGRTNTQVQFNSDDPLLTGNSLLKSFKELSPSIKNVLIDITTFTHEGLLILFRFIWLYKERFNKVFLSYTGADEYDVDESDPDKKWLTKGTKSIRSVLGYPGLLNPSRKNHLIILFGFESERTQKLIENFEFEKVSLGFGPENDSIKEDHYFINRKRHLRLLEQFPIAEKFEFSLTDPILCKNQLLARVNMYSQYNTVIVPLNNKISTIGAALSALENNSIQITYVRAHEYNIKGYSRSSEKFYLIDLKDLI
jgi:hypothetical protein